MQLWVNYISFIEISKSYDLEKSLLTPVKHNKLVLMRSMPPPKAPASSYKVVEHLHNCAGRLCMKEMSKSDDCNNKIQHNLTFVLQKTLFA